MKDIYCPSSMNPLARALVHLAHTGEIPIGVEKSQILDPSPLLLGFWERNVEDVSIVVVSEH